MLVGEGGERREWRMGRGGRKESHSMERGHWLDEDDGESSRSI